MGCRMLPAKTAGLYRSLAATTILLACLSAASGPLGAQSPEKSSPAEPEVSSIYPLGARPGDSLRAEVLGQDLDGCYALWFSQEGLSASIQGIETLESEQPGDYATGESKPDRPRQRVSLQLTVDPEAGPGEHRLRLVTPRGVSNSLRFLVAPYPAIREGETPELLPLQVAVNGRIRQGGEEDTYAFQVSKGQRIGFEVLYDPGPPRIPGRPVRKTLDPELTLYASGGSWFDPRRPVRLAFNDEPLSPRLSKAARLAYNFAASGRYFIKVGSFKGLGSPDYCYQLRLTSLENGDLPHAPAGRPAPEHPGREPEWKERDFERVLGQTHLLRLGARTVEPPQAPPTCPGPESGGTPAASGSAAGHPPTPVSGSGRLPDPVEEGLSNNSFGEALAVSLPVLVEGAIEHPGDVDTFKFQVGTGDRLAFEIETPESGTPRFNPRLGVFDSDGREFLTNVYKRIGRNDQFYLKTVEPKTLYTFRLGGEHFLQIRDVTSRYGDPGFRYRLLIRPQVPHVGDIQVLEDRLNLKQGQARKLTVTTAQEEGFEHDIAVTLEGLPEGVQLLPGTQVEPDKGPPLDEGEKDRFVPKTEKAILMLLAEASAPATSMPRLVQVSARVVIDGKVGPRLAVKRIPVMVTASPQQVSSLETGGKR